MAKRFKDELYTPLKGAGRASKLPARGDEIIKLLQEGNTIDTACALVGIHNATYHNWVKEGRALAGLRAAGERIPKARQMYLDFFDAVMHAQQSAARRAVKTIHNAIEGYTQREEHIKRMSETRLTRDGTPYEYVREERLEISREVAGDWRAALEYVKRRHPESWSLDINVNLNIWNQAVTDIAAGAIDFDVLREEVGDELARELFQRAGVPVASE